MTGAQVVDITKNNILATVDLTSYKSIKDLYEDLLALKKDVYQDNERIVIVYNPTLDKTLELVKQLLNVIDIPEYFIVFDTTNDTNDNSLNFNFSKNHCIYPWSNLEIRNTGEFAPCCKFQGSILNDQGIPMTVRDSSINDVYSSNFMKNLRNSFRQGINPPNCNICWLNEQSGENISLRQRAAYKFRDVYYKLDYINDDINNIRSMDLKLGNTCNLSCRICSPGPSSKIATMELNAGRLAKIDFDQIRKNTQWCDTDDFWYQFLPIARNLRELDILGGEPLLVKSHYNFLKKLVELDVAKTIRLDYTSNGTVFSEAYMTLWQEFQEVKISFSIDDIEDRFEYQRNGAVWQDVTSNIARYSSLKSSKFITEVYPTINIQNVYYLPELVNWIDTVGFDHISYGFLHEPEYLSIANLTGKAKEIVLDKLTQYQEQHPMIVAAIKMVQDSTTTNNTDFLSQMKLRDSERAQNFAMHHIDIAKAMGYE